MLEEFLISIDFIPLFSDPSALINRKVIVNRLTLAVYVDDLFINGEYKKDIIYVKQLLKIQFEVKDLRKI